MANTWWKLGPEPRSDLTLMPMLLTLLHTAPGLIIHLQNHPPNRPWPWGLSRTLSRSTRREGSFNAPGWSSTLPQQGKAGEGEGYRVLYFGGKTSRKLFTLWASHLFCQPLPSQQSNRWKRQGKSATTNRARTKALSFLLAMEAAPHHLNFSARKKLVSGVRRPKVHPHFVGFVIQTLTGRGRLLQSKLSTDDLSTTVLVIGYCYDY